MSEISKLAAVDPAARIGSHVSIGPFTCIGPDVTLGDGCQVMNNVTITGRTSIGEKNVFYPNAVIGAAPQDLKYRGDPTETIIGARNVFRENVNVHRGTELGGRRTVIGSDNLLMVGCHIAHDCILEDRIIVGNESLLAGHVKIETGVVVEALVGIHQFVTLGKYSYIGAMTPVRRDVPPFAKFSGDPNAVRGANEEGLRRNGFSDEDVTLLKQAVRRLFRRAAGACLADNLNQLESQDGLNENVRYLCRAVRASSETRFGRHLENARADKADDRRRCNPADIRRMKD